MRNNIQILEIIFNNIEYGWINVDLLLDSDNKTYKVYTTKDICPSFTKGIGRSKSGIDIKTHLVNQSDYLCILEQPKNDKSILTIFKTTDILMDQAGII